MASLRWSVVRPQVRSAAPSQILEIGCGQGSFGARLARFAPYTGLEPDRASFLVARDRVHAAGARVLNATCEAVAPEGQFDLLCAFEVLEHLEDDLGSLRDWLRRLCPGGTLLVSVPAWPERYTVTDELVGHYRRYAPDELASLLVRAGCRPPRVMLYGWPLGYALEAVRTRIARHRGVSTEESMEARSQTSGRFLQPRRAAGALVRGATAPFAQLQRLRPGTGTGLIAVATRS